VWEDQKVLGTEAQSAVKRIFRKPNIVTFEVLPFCTYAIPTVVLPLLEVPL
jgi:hypothetical protein